MFYPGKPVTTSNIILEVKMFLGLQITNSPNYVRYILLSTLPRVWVEVFTSLPRAYFMTFFFLYIF